MKIMWKFSLLFTLLSAVNVLAQNTNILTTKIQPVDVQKIVSQRNIAKVVALANAEKLKKVKELMKDKVKPEQINSLTLFSPINLNVQNSIVNEKAFLVFDAPMTMSAYENQAVFNPTDSSQSKIKVVFNAPATGFYVFDFYIKKGPTGNSKSQSLKFVEPFSNITNRILGAEQFQHQIFVAQAKNTGWSMIWLESQDAIWSFVGLEISQIK